MQTILTLSEAQEVFSVLKGSLDKHFESVTLSFGLLFRRETEKFKACCGLTCALTEEGLLDSRQRLLALYAVLDLHRERSQDVHPFWDFLISMGVADKTAVEEVELIHLFLVQKKGAELGKLNCNEFVLRTRSMPDSVIQSHSDDLIGLYNEYWDERCGVGALGQAGLRRVLVDKRSCQSGQLVLNQSAIFEALASQLTVSGFQPGFLRPMPPIAKSIPGEEQWLSPDLKPKLVLDIGAADLLAKKIEDLDSLLQECSSYPLTSAQQDTAVEEIEADPEIVFRCDLDPDNLPSVVENAPILASEILRHLVPSPKGDSFLQSLMSMSSLRSMEVVNNLATSTRLPDDFVEGYISNCISACNAIEDRRMQARLVRLVCVLIQSLIKNGIISMTNLLHEVQAFCIDHSRIREAAALFRMLKHMENEGESSSGEPIC